MKKLLIVAVAASAITAGPAFAGAKGNGAFSGDPNQCLAAERAVRNSNGGDREHGGFGEAQSAFVAMFDEGFNWNNQWYYDYGQWLKDWKAACNG